jgi:hypothetical protein
MEYDPQILVHMIIITIWLSNIAMEHGPFIDGLPIKNGDCPWQTVKLPDGIGSLKPFCEMWATDLGNTRPRRTGRRPAARREWR